MATDFSLDHQLNQVLIKEHSRGLKVILNRPQKNNSLTYEMISQISRALKVYENDSAAKVVILKGNGKAFCAGGDVVKLVLSIAKGHWTFGARFYEKQLILDYMISTYKKPLVSFINGFVMGGGAGLVMHGKIRIVTEKAVFAMPETSLGLYPDVGASHFLSRLPGFFGEYLGLTGARIDGSEMLACGLATHFVLSKDLLLLENELCEMVSYDMVTIYELISKFAYKTHVKQDSAYRRLEIINTCFSGKTVEEIMSSLEKEATNNDDIWLGKAISSMKKAAPLSLKVALRLIREGRMQNLEQCLSRDYTVVCNMLRKSVSNDFYEGSRALLFDKDQNPKWEPSKLELVTEEMIEMLFAKIDVDDWEYLQLPVRSELVTNMANSRL